MCVMVCNVDVTILALIIVFVVFFGLSDFVSGVVSVVVCILILFGCIQFLSFLCILYTDHDTGYL